MGLKKGIFKKGVMSSTLIYWLIAIAILALMIVFIVLLKENLWGIGQKIKSLFMG